MTLVLFSPFVLQGIAMLFDEFYFHRKRGLPLWEKLGHPLDSFSVLCCYIFLFLFEYSASHLWVYVGLCVISSLLITKDEFVHKQKCVAKENWLHAFLFVLHPIAFLAAGILWSQSCERSFFMVQSLAIVIFIVYQIIYWGFCDKRRG